MHDKYMDSDAYFDAYTYELEQALIEQKIESAKERGEEKGKLKEKREMLIKQLTIKLKTLSMKVIDMINQATYKQLDKLTIHIFDIDNEDKIIEIMNDI